MEHHNKVLFPAFLIIFASFLAFAINDLVYYDFEDNQDRNFLAGMAVVNTPSCEDNDASIFGLYANGNSHLFTVDSGETSGICAQLSDNLAVTNPSRQCDNSLENLVAYLANGTMISYLDPITNAHIYGPEASASDLPPAGDYIPVCYQRLECRTSDSCDATEECVLSFEGVSGSAYNAHAAVCGFYKNQLCCKKNDGLDDDLDDDFCGVGNINCDDFDLDHDNSSLGEDTMKEAESTTLTCSPGCSGISCCEALTVTCDETTEKQCMKFYDLIGYPNPPFENPDVKNAVCYMSNDGEFSWGYPGAELQEENCNDFFDNDCDGQTDEGDTDCNIVIPPDCADALVGSSFKWSPTGPVERGDSVEIILDISGSNECDGITFGVSVINPDAKPGDQDYLSVVDPSPLVVAGSIGKTSWYAENSNPGPIPDIAKWKAKGFNLGGLVVPPSTILQVNATTNYCGDGQKNEDAGEQCDDGNTDDDDGCSENCLIEGLDGPGNGDDCSSYCVKGTSVCGLDGLYYCGDYDGDGCNELKFGDACVGKICSSEFGNCVNPGCTVKNLPAETNPSCSSASGASWVCGKWGDCVNNQRTRICNECVTGVCPLNPVENVSCSSEPGLKASFFDMWSTFLAILVIGLYYFFRNSNLKIKSF